MNVYLERDWTASREFYAPSGQRVLANGTAKIRTKKSNGLTLTRSIKFKRFFFFRLSGVEKSTVLSDRSSSGMTSDDHPLSSSEEREAGEDDVEEEDDDYLVEAEMKKRGITRSMQGEC